MEPRYLVPVEQSQAAPNEADNSEKQLKRLELIRRVDQQGGEAEDQGGYVKVVVDNCGRVQSIRLDPRLSATAMDGLGPHIAAVCAKAFNHRVEQVRKIVAANADYLDQATVDAVEAMTQRFGR